MTTFTPIEIKDIEIKDIGTMLLDRLLEETRGHEKLKTDYAARGGEVAALIDQVHTISKEVAGKISELASHKTLLRIVEERLSELQKRQQSADAPLTELWRAADEIVRAKSGSNLTAMKARLRAAVIASSDHVDLIPF